MKERKKIIHQWSTWKKATDKKSYISSNNVERKHEKKEQTLTHSEKTKTTPGNASRHRVLLAEDDYEMRALLAMALRKSGYIVIECSDGIGMLTYLAAFLLPDEFAEESVDLIISDIRMPGVTGMEVLQGKPKKQGFPPMILITAFGDAETHALSNQFGAAAIFDKPFDVDVFLEKVKDVLSGSHAHAGN
jgi:DNA-binding response OmpR family regulator